MADDRAGIVFQQRGNFYDATVDRFNVDAFIAEDALFIDDFEFVVTEIAARGFVLRGVCVESGFDFRREGSLLFRQGRHEV